MNESTNQLSTNKHVFTNQDAKIIEKTLLKRCTDYKVSMRDRATETREFCSCAVFDYKDAKCFRQYDDI